MFDFLGPIKIYVMAAGAAIIAIFIGVYKYRGFKVEELEAEVDAKDKELEVVVKVVEQEREVAEFTADNRVAKAKAEIVDEEVVKDYVVGKRFSI